MHFYHIHTLCTALESTVLDPIKDTTSEAFKQLINEIKDAYANSNTYECERKITESFTPDFEWTLSYIRRHTSDTSTMTHTQQSDMIHDVIAQMQTIYPSYLFNPSELGFSAAYEKDILNLNRLERTYKLKKEATQHAAQILQR